MNAKILIFGTLFLLGNITLTAQELNRKGLSFSEKNIQTTTRKGVRDELEERLVKRGIDDDAAKDLADNSLEDNEILASIKINNYLSAIEVEYDDLMNQLALRALFNKKIDFENYDTLVGITHDIHNKHLDKTTLEKLSQIATINKNLKIQFIS
jgi:hypothetical protein